MTQVSFRRLLKSLGGRVHKVAVSAAVYMQVNKAGQHIAARRVHPDNALRGGLAKGGDFSVLHQQGAFPDPVGQHQAAIANPKRVFHGRYLL